MTKELKGRGFRLNRLRWNALDYFQQVALLKAVFPRHRDIIQLLIDVGYTTDLHWWGIVWVEARFYGNYPNYKVRVGQVIID